MNPITPPTRRQCLVAGASLLGGLPATGAPLPGPAPVALSGGVFGYASVTFNPAETLMSAELLPSQAVFAALLIDHYLP